MTTQEIPFTVGKIEEGVAVLVTDDLQMVEFPAHYLPKFEKPDGQPIGIGSVLSLKITHSLPLQASRNEAFISLQDSILSHFSHPPSADVLGSCLKLDGRSHSWIMVSFPSWKVLAKKHGWTAKIHSIDCQVNRSIAFYGIGEEETLIRLTGLDTDQAFEIRLVFRTSTGTFYSNIVTVSTCSPSDFTGLHLVIDEDAGQEALDLAKELGAMVYAPSDLDKNITTHVIAENGQRYGDLHLDIPIVNVDWLKACKASGKIEPVCK
jgi:hypothetical protein